ncbi:MAG: HDOD domain-containing protein [Acidobacteriota bacterium]|nr:HDOD domain-containing protein [Acidobacteriota bacterium]
MPITVGENDPVISTSSSTDQSYRDAIVSIQPRQRYVPSQRFNVPVMQETLLLIELEAQEFCVDLRMLSEVILTDLGATLQVLRLAGQDHDRATDSPIRMEDCISDLGTQACIESMSAKILPCGRRSNAIPELWSHSLEIARQSKRIAEQTTNLDPDRAYLAGLCHSIGSLPAVLGWGGKRRLDSVLTGLELASEWSLPSFLLDYFSCLQGCGGRSPELDIVQAAHRCAGQLPCEDVLPEELCPQLLWAV